MRIAFIGHGNVGGALAAHLQRLGHEVTVAAPPGGSASLDRLLARGPALRTAPAREAVAGAEVVFLATPFGAAAGVLPPLADALAGKVLVDCTNPVGPGLAHGLDSRTSATAELQRLAPGARVVKAFSVYGWENFEAPPPARGGLRPAMPFCGEDAPAKATVARLLAQLGWEPLDVGGVAQALHLEHLALLWVRMVRVQGASPHLLWAALTPSAAEAAR